MDRRQFGLAKSTGLVRSSGTGNTPTRTEPETSVGNDYDSERQFKQAQGFMGILSSIQDFGDGTALVVFSILIKLYFYMVKDHIDDLRKVCDILISKGILDIFVRVWDSCHQNTAEFYAHVEEAKFTTLRQLKTIFWNYSDKCVNLAEACYKDGRIIERLMREFTIPELAVSHLNKPGIGNVLVANLGILHNLVRLCNRNREHIRKDKGVEKMLKYVESTPVFIKTKIFIVLAYCVNEDENSKILTEKGVLTIIIRLLDSAIASPNHQSSTGNSFSAEELVMALNKLAVNDSNKKTIVLAGVLPSLTQLLDPKTSSPSEQLQAMNCIWSLAFHSENKDKIIEETNLIKQAKNLRAKRETDKELSRAIDCFLFVLFFDNSTKEVSKGKQTGEKHIMLSYQWDVQEKMLTLCKYLEQKGYKTWMDVSEMKGSTLDSMAKAIENANVVLVAMTNAYKDSNSCRTEGEYAYKKNVPVVPLLLQPNYNPDGWLGALLGTKLYVDLSSTTFEAKFSEVKRHIDLALPDQNLRPASDIPQVPTRPPLQKSHTVPEFSGRDSIRSRTCAYLKTSLPCREWSTKKVQEWCKEIGIKGNEALNKLDGKLLSQLCKMLARSPAEYYSFVSTEFGIWGNDKLRLTEAVESLLSA